MSVIAFVKSATKIVRSENADGTARNVRPRKQTETGDGLICWGFSACHAIKTATG